MPDMRISTRAHATIRMPDGTTREVTLELTPDQITTLNNPDGKHYSMGCNIASKDQSVNHSKYQDSRNIFSDEELEGMISKQRFSPDSKFEIWASTSCFVDRVKTIEEAKNYIRYKRKEARWIIRPPQGYWHSMARD